MARLIYKDVVGLGERPKGPSLSKIGLAGPAQEAFIEAYGADFQLSPPQSWAIDEQLLDSPDHYLVCAPTNSGKTLIALLRIFHRSLVTQKRFVYVVPLKALAEEKAVEFEGLSERVHKHGGKRFEISKSTGDYQLTEDFFDSAPSDSAEIVICTPERLDVIARNADNLRWLQSVDTFVFDEFHLMGERNRGPTMECLVTRVLTLCPDSSVLALSATVGNPGQIAEWLGHTGRKVHKLVSDFRYPRLERQVVEVADKNEYLAAEARRLLADPRNSILIFVYTKNDTEKLAKQLGEFAGCSRQVACFHAGLLMAKRLHLAREFQEGRLRVLVTTTSLKMGVNTPATHVFVRDTIFMGNGRLTTADVLQMLGRAGRGDMPGVGVVLVTESEGQGSLDSDLKCGDVDEIRPQLVTSDTSWQTRNQGGGTGETGPILSAVLTEFARHEYLTAKQLSKFFTHTYSGWMHGLESRDYSLEISTLIQGKLIYKVENSESTYGPTKLGKTTSFCGLSPESGAMLGGFLRALIKLAQKQEELDGKPHNYLRRLSDLDLLFLAVASFEGRQYLPSRISKKRREELVTLIEQLEPEQKPLVNLWRSATSKDYPTRRLLSSLRLPVPDGNADTELAYYRVMQAAVLLLRHANGADLSVLAREYKLHPGAIESGLKFTTIWVLHCLAQICTPERCYNLRFIALRCYELIENLTFGSTLGKLMSIKGVGRRSVQTLIDSGFSKVEQLKSQDIEKLTALGVKRKQARKIMSAANRSGR